MMLGSPRIVAFDNEADHLDALIRGINGAGGACLGYHYTGDIDDMKIVACPYARVIFFDLNMVDLATPSNFLQHYSNIGELLGRIAPKGPYLLVLWTHYADRANELQKFLDQRLEDVCKPFTVEALPKEKYLSEDGKIKSIDKLVLGIRCTVQESSALAALSDWESKVSSAAAETLASVSMLGSGLKGSKIQQRDIPRLMAEMSKAAAGQDNVAANPSRAMGDALLPVLADHVSSSLSQCDSAALWQKVLDRAIGGLCEEEAAQLNSAIHFAMDIGTQQGVERGAVVPLDSILSVLGLSFKEVFGIGMCQAARRQFKCKSSQLENTQWVLVQAQAACDYAQRQPGPLPFYLGIDMPKSASASGKPPDAVWKSPFFRTDGEIRELRVSARFHVSLTSNRAQDVEPIYRLREQILGTLIHSIHSYGGRPGAIMLRV